MNVKFNFVTMIIATSLAGCGGGSDDGSDTPLVNVVVKTQGATSFAVVDDKVGEFKALEGETFHSDQSIDCKDFVRGIESGQIDMPNSLAPAFEFPHDDELLKCSINSVVATTDNLYLQGDFWNFTVAPEVDEDDEYPQDALPTTMSCSILKIPMYDVASGGDAIECLAHTHVDGVFTQQSSISYDSLNETLYFTGFNTSTSPATLYSHNSNDKLVVVRENITYGGMTNSNHNVFVANGGEHILVEHGGMTLVSGDQTQVFDEKVYDSNCYRHPDGGDSGDYGYVACDPDIPSQASVGNASRYGDTVFTGMFRNGHSNLIFNLKSGEWTENSMSKPFIIRYASNTPELLYGDRNSGHVFTQNPDYAPDVGMPERHMSAFNHDLMTFGSEAELVTVVGSVSNIETMTGNYIYAGGLEQGAGKFEYSLKIFEPSSDYVHPIDLTTILAEECPRCNGFNLVGSWSDGAIIDLTNSYDGDVISVYLKHNDDFTIYRGEAKPLVEVYNF
ncbi:hypothetical protein [Vibrio celticus]|uniref:hypothetical protein n=1 Tax=Vibrio celticus TaxID=446372 RepID=UPI004067DA2D